MGAVHLCINESTLGAVHLFTDESTLVAQSHHLCFNESILISGRDGLSNIRVSVPSIVLRGETTSFNCSYDVEPHDKVT